jgi:non-specific serine/threonine protein kinase
MDYYEGNTLEYTMVNHQLSIEESINKALQIAQGLKLAHEKGIVHRDIKPSNIILTQDGSIKILDFGLAKLQEQTKITKEGTTVGTVAYMSPEQVIGENVDARSDLWSWGVVLYEMISAKQPFKGVYDEALIYSIKNETQEPLTDLVSAVPAELEKIVNKCLEKNPSDRYQQMDELIIDLGKLQDHETSQIVPTKQNRIRNYFLLPIIVLVLLIVGYFILDELLSLQKPGTKTDSVMKWENSIAVLPFKNFSPDPDQDFFCDGMTEQIINNLSKLRQLKVISRTSAMKFKNSELGIPEIASSLNVRFVLEGSVRKSQNRIRVTAQLINAKDDFHLWSEDYDREVTDFFELQDNISQKIVTALLEEIPAVDVKKIKTQRPSDMAAYEYFLRGTYYHEKKFLYDAADIESFQLAEMMFKKAIAIDPKYAVSKAALADLYHTYYVTAARNEEERKEYLKLTNKYLDQSFGLDSTLAYNYLIKGRVQSINNNHKSAFECFKRAIELNPNSGWMTGTMAHFLRSKGLILQAIYYYDKAIELDPLEPIFYNSRGIAYMYLGHFDRAQRDYQKALELKPDMVFALVNQLNLFIDMGELVRAEKLFEHVAQIKPDIHELHAKLYAAKEDKEKALQLMGAGQNMQVFSLLGMKDEAVQFMENTLDRDKKSETSYYLLYKTNPCYDKLRDDPRFDEMLEKHKQVYEEIVKKYGDLDLSD